MPHYNTTGFLSDGRKLPERQITPTFLDGTAECIICGEMCERECPTCDEPVCGACSEEHTHPTSTPRGEWVRLNPQISPRLFDQLFPSSKKEAA